MKKENKRILLVGNYLPDMQKSMNAYVATLNEGLKEAGWTPTILRPKKVLLLDIIKNPALRKWIAYIDKYIIFSLYLFFKSWQFKHVCICDHSNAIYVSFSGKVKTIVICHDVIAIQAARGLIEGWRVGRTGRKLQQLILDGLRKAKKVVCVSNLTRTDLIELAPELVSKAVVISNPLNFPYSPDTNWKETLGKTDFNKRLPEKYLIHVGSDLPRKNRLFILRTLVELKNIRFLDTLKVLFVGPGPNQAMTDFIHQNDLLNDVVFFSNVDSVQLQAFYSGAAFMLFPSLNEGFGWPVIEAQACGCPVFASNIQPMPEVGGGAAMYIDPRDPQNTAKAISEADLSEMRKSGLENAKRFELPEMISQFAHALET